MTKESDRGSYASPEGSAAWEYAAAVICSFFFISAGAVLGWNSAALPELLGPESKINVTETDALNLVRGFGGGMMLAPIISLIFTNSFGRKKSLLITGIPMMTSWGLIAIAEQVMVLVIARFLAGLSLGLTFSLAPMYMGEIASVKLRGTLGAVIGTTVNAGLLVMYLVLPYLKIVPTACAALAILIVAEILLWFIPESPYYLVMMEKEDEAEISLEKLRGKTDVSEELDLIKRTISETMQGKIRRGMENSTSTNSSKFMAFKELFTVRANRKALCINFLFACLLQLGGYTILMIYGSIIFEALNTGISSNICNVIIAILQLIFNVITTYTIDKVGRRTLILISGSIGGVCYLATGVYLYIDEHTDFDVSPYRILPFCMLIIYIIIMNIGITPLMIVIQSETFAPEISAHGICFVGMAGGLISSVGAPCFLNIAQTWGFGFSISFIICAIMSFVFTALILTLIPETRGKTLLEIQRNLNE